MTDIAPGTMVVAAAKGGSDDQTFLDDLTGIFKDGGFSVVPGRTPCQRVNIAAEAAAAINLDPVHHGRPANPVDLRWTRFQSSAGRRRRGDPGADDAATGWEFAGYLSAWGDLGPAALVGVVTDVYDGVRHPPGELLKAFGRFVRQLLDQYQA